ncbi:MAG: altronate dehydratase [Bacteroidaceae bacterium]|nr:altronate dehydratase [Bacteroidaceae bacterium]
MKTIQIHPADNVAVALEDLPGIPAGHKIALRDFKEGDPVVKYGFPIGHVIHDVKQGALIDHRDIRTNLSGTLDYEDIRGENLSACPLPPVPTRQSTFAGFLRSDGQVGIRNELWVIPTVGCVDGIVRRVVDRARRELWREGEGVDAIVGFPHNYGCSQLGDDHENTRKILRDMVHHPNAGGVLVIGLGCENNQPRLFQEFCGDYDRERVRFMTCQEVEGDEEEVAMQLLTELYQRACTCKRTPQPLSKLRVGLKCGGSDGFSGITANPLLGRFSDWLCMEQGGTTVLTEVPEMFGAETLLMRRCATPELLEQTIRLINDFKTYFLSHGQPVGENPSPGNKAGGISTLEEKALGCTQKSGSSPVRGVLPYGERIGEGRGLHLLSAPGNDLVASTALAAAGCQLVLFTTGRGTPFATFVPTMKVSTNSRLAQAKPHWIDFNAGALIEGTSMDELLRDFRSLVLEVCEGHRTQSEQRGGAEIAIFKNGVTL